MVWLKKRCCLLMKRKKRCGSHPHWSSSSFYHYHFSDALCILQIYHHYYHYYYTFLIINLLLRHRHRHRFPSSPSLGFSFLLPPSPTQIPNHIPPPFRLSFLLSSMTTTKRAYKLRILPFPSLHFYLLLLSYVSNFKFIIHLHPSSFLRRCDLKFAVDVILIYFPCTPSDLINEYVFSFQI